MRFSRQLLFVSALPRFESRAQYTVAPVAAWPGGLPVGGSSLPGRCIRKDEFGDEAGTSIGSEGLETLEPVRLVTGTKTGVPDQ